MMKELSGSERRTEKRVWLKIPVTINKSRQSGASYTSIGETLNVSRHGACLISDCELAQGDALSLVTFGASSADAIPGHVTWSEPVGLRHRIGVRFDNDPIDWIIA